MKKTRRVLVMMVLTVLCLSCLLSFCSCVGRVTYRDPADYATARGDVTFGLEADNSLCEFFPDVEESKIQEMYIYDKELTLEQNYICYLNCVYSDEEYQTEVARIQSYFEKHSWVEDTKGLNVLSDTQNIISRGNIVAENDQNDELYRIAGACILLRPEENRIIYFIIHADAKKWFWKKSYNLPEEYLPDGFIELRDSQTK